MENIGNVAFGILMFGIPVYFILRFNFGGLCFGLLALWIIFGIFSSFFPLNRLGWNPFDSLVMFLTGWIFYAIPWLAILGLKVVIVRAINSKKNKNSDSLPLDVEKA